MSALAGAVTDTPCKTSGFLWLLSLWVFCVLFFLHPVSPVFSEDDIGSLTMRGDEALARGDYEQALWLGKRIVDQDPRNLTGYRLALICCVMKNWELGFYKIIEDAKKQGVDKLAIDRLAAEICFVGRQRVCLDKKLAEYETQWRELHDPSH